MQHNYHSEQAEPTTSRARTPVDWANVHRQKTGDKGGSRQGKGGAWGGRGRPPSYAEVAAWKMRKEEAEGRSRRTQQAEATEARPVSDKGRQRIGKGGSSHQPMQQQGVGWQQGPAYPWSNRYYTSGRGPRGPSTARTAGLGWRGGAGGTPNVKPPSHTPCQAVVGAEGVADQSGGHAGLIAGSLPEGAADQSIRHGSPTVGSHLEAPELGRGQHLPTKQQQPQAQGHSQPLTGPL